MRIHKLADQYPKFYLQTSGHSKEYPLLVRINEDQKGHAFVLEFGEGMQSIRTIDLWSSSTDILDNEEAGFKEVLDAELSQYFQDYTDKVLRRNANFKPAQPEPPGQPPEQSEPETLDETSPPL